MNNIAEAPTVESPVFVRSTVFEARDCRVEIVREGGGGAVVAVVVVAREGVSVARVETPGRGGAGGLGCGARRLGACEAGEGAD